MRLLLQVRNLEGAIYIFLGDKPVHFLVISHYVKFLLFVHPLRNSELTIDVATVCGINLSNLSGLEKDG